MIALHCSSAIRDFSVGRISPTAVFNSRSIRGTCAEDVDERDLPLMGTFDGRKLLTWLKKRFRSMPIESIRDRLSFFCGWGRLNNYEKHQTLRSTSLVPIMHQPTCFGIWPKLLIKPIIYQWGKVETIVRDGGERLTADRSRGSLISSTLTAPS